MYFLYLENPHVIEWIGAPLIYPSNSEITKPNDKFIVSQIYINTCMYVTFLPMFHPCTPPIDSRVSPKVNYTNRAIYQRVVWPMDFPEPLCICDIHWHHIWRTLHPLYWIAWSANDHRWRDANGHQIREEFVFDSRHRYTFLFAVWLDVGSEQHVDMPEIEKKKQDAIKILNPWRQWRIYVHMYITLLCVAS